MIDLDNNATTRVAGEVLAAMEPRSCGAAMTRLVVFLIALLPVAVHAGIEISPRSITLAPNAVAGPIASNGDGFLAAFQPEYPYSRFAVMPLDSAGRPAADVAKLSSDGAVQVVRLGDHYLMKWGAPGRHRLSEVSPDGAVLRDWPGSTPSRAAHDLYSTTSGDRVLLLDRGNARAILLTAEGAVVAEVTFPSRVAQVRPGPHRFVVASLIANPIFINTIEPDGSQSQPVTIEPNNAVTGAAYALDLHDRILVAWVEASASTLHGSTGFQVHTVLLNGSDPTAASAMTVEPTRTGVVTPFALLPSADGAVLLLRSSTSSHYGAADTRIVAVPLSATGAPDGEPQVIHESAGLPLPGGAATNGELIVIHMTDPGPTGSRAVALAFPARFLALVRSHTTSIALQAQTSPVTASDGATSLVVWREASPLGDALRGRMVSPTAGPIGEVMTIASTDGAFGQHTVAFGAGIYLVVWHHWQQLWGARVSIGGEILDREPILIRDGVGRPLPEPAAASDGSNFLVVWMAPGGVVGSIVTPSGVVAGPRDIYSPDSVFLTVYDHDVGWDGASYVYVWTRLRSSGFPGPVETDVRAIRVSRDGVADRPSETVIFAGGSRVKAGSSDSGLLVTFSGLGAHLPTGSLTPGPVFELARPGSPAAKPQFDGNDFVLGFPSWSGGRLLVARVAPGSTDVRRSFASSPRASYAPVHVAVSSDGTAGLVTSELSGSGSDAPTWRVMLYLHHEFAANMRRRAVRF